MNGIYLEKGKNTITLGEGWSWFYLDYIRITNGSCLEDSFYNQVDQSLTNPNSTEKTQRIYQYLLSIYGKRTLAGQCTNYGTNTETDALFTGLGRYPALRTFDFIYDSYSACQGKPKAKDVDLAIEWDKMGGLVAFDWHWYAPYGKSAFYADERYRQYFFSACYTSG